MPLNSSTESFWRNLVIVTARSYRRGRRVLGEKGRAPQSKWMVCEETQNPKVTRCLGRMPAAQVGWGWYKVLGNGPGKVSQGKGRSWRTLTRLQGQGFFWRMTVKFYTEAVHLLHVSLLCLLVSPGFGPHVETVFMKDENPQLFRPVEVCWEHCTDTSSGWCCQWLWLL